MVYLFLNADEYLAARRLRALKAAVGDAELAGLNITELEGPQTDAGEILGQASMLPFLADRRLVIVRGYLAHLEKRMAASKGPDSAAHAEAARFLNGLAEVGESSDLVLVEPSLDKRRSPWKGFRLAQEGAPPAPGVQELVQAGQIQIEEQTTPDARSLPGWISQEAKTRRIAIEPQAVQLLAAFVGTNLRQIENELVKLATYARERPITAEDVHLLVSDASEAMVWSLTDALSQRNPRAAMQALQGLRRGDANAFYLLTMIARQYRIMLKVKEAMRSQRGANEYDLAKQLGEKPYPIKKAMQQAAGYSFDELIGVLDRLLEADYAMKTGADPDTEIDLLIAELTRR
ncbi:MAG TPA: DNA polymerase III subunit delta [Caldilineaceae bacterium]|nr:DNA polymerase III subunit delta [Caldilineaceae bacterium]